ncbi:MAG: DivIVA domain-containing protein [Microbacteriaceae bacterium]|nr:DivIVA domain-containing protein [Microbacteriaceae bacterium]
MASTFPRLRKSRRGYNVDQVEEFLVDARAAYGNAGGASLNSQDIRRTSFSMQKGGYSPTHVDAALERLEDAFATRERDQARATVGDQAWFNQARAMAREIIARLDRVKKKRFRRVGFLSSGYDCKQVDELCDRLTRYFRQGEKISVEEIRTVAFRPKKGGYSETQVDLFLDATIEVILSVS